MHELTEMKEEGKRRKKAPDVISVFYQDTVKFSITFPWVFCLYSAGDSLILPTLSKWMGARTAIWLKRASTYQQQLKTVCCHQNECSVLQLILQEPSGKPDLGHRPTWPSSRTAQSPVASAEALLGLGSYSETDGTRAVCCWCAPGCDHQATWNWSLFTTFLQNLLHDSSMCNSQEVFVIHTEIFPCWALPLWIS